MKVRKKYSVIRRTGWMGYFNQEKQMFVTKFKWLAFVMRYIFCYQDYDEQSVFIYIKEK